VNDRVYVIFKYCTTSRRVLNLNGLDVQPMVLIVSILDFANSSVFVVREEPLDSIVQGLFKRCELETSRQAKKLLVGGRFAELAVCASRVELQFQM